MNTSIEVPDTDSGADLFGRQGVTMTWATAVLLMLLIAVLDRVSGYDLRLVLLQLVPVAMITWACGRGWGWLAGVASVAVWLLTFRGSHHYAGVFYFYWDGAILLVTFSVMSGLLARVHDLLHEDDARVDAMLESLDVPVCVIDPRDGTVLQANRLFRERAGEADGRELARALAAAPGARARELPWTGRRRVTLVVGAPA